MKRTHDCQRYLLEEQHVMEWNVGITQSGLLITDTNLKVILDDIQ
jgi:hypothetical protein